MYSVLQLLLVRSLLHSCSRADSCSTSAAIILFIFSVTSGSNNGWATPYVLAPLIISALLLGAFFFWESHIDEADAAMYVPPYFQFMVLIFRLCSPPSLWRYPNVPVLVVLALLPSLWYVGVFLQDTSWFQEWFGWSALNTAVHL